MQKKCTICARNVSNLKFHMQTNHSEKNSKTKECFLCLQLFLTNQHVDDHFRTTQKKDIDEKLTCNMCIYATWRKSDMTKHRSNVHGPQNKTPCNICGKAYRTGRDIENHKRTHEQKTVECDQCHKMTTENALRQHKNTHKNVTFSCNICNKEFTRKSTVTSHKKRVHE